MKALFIVGCLLLIPFDTSAEKKETGSLESDCTKRGGNWMGTESGRGRITGCNMPTKDGGKSCSKGEDCESVCLPDGKCYGWTLYKGCGMYRGHAGVVCVE